MLKSTHNYVDFFGVFKQEPSFHHGGRLFIPAASLRVESGLVRRGFFFFFNPKLGRACCCAIIFFFKKILTWAGFFVCVSVYYRL